jgi:hypothetical protein
VLRIRSAILTKCTERQKKKPENVPALIQKVDFIAQ